MEASSKTYGLTNVLGSGNLVHQGDNHIYVVAKTDLNDAQTGLMVNALVTAQRQQWQRFSTSTENAYPSRRSARRTRLPEAVTLLKYQSTWLCRAWHIETMGSLGNWTISLRTWRTLHDPCDPILTCIGSDDLDTFRRLLDSRRYSINDQVSNWVLPDLSYEYSVSLLEVAMRYGALDIVNFYMSLDWRLVERFINGLPRFTSENGNTTFACLIKFAIDADCARLEDNASLNVEARTSILGALLRAYSEEGVDDEVTVPFGAAKMLKNICGRVPFSREDVAIHVEYSCHVLRISVDNLITDLPRFTREEKVECVLAVLKQLEDARSFKFMMEKTNIDLACIEAALVLRTPRTNLISLLGDVVGNHMRSQHNQRNLRRQRNKDICCCSFDEELYHLVRNAHSLQSRDIEARLTLSPLLRVLRSTYRRSHNVQNVILDMEATVHGWLGILQKSGVDLEIYGQQEHNFLKKMARIEDTDWIIDRYKWYLSEAEEEHEKLKVHLVSFRWGKKPDDWHFWFSSSQDEIGNVSLLNHVSTKVKPHPNQERSFSIPGAWPNEAQTMSSLSREYLTRIAESRRRRTRYLKAHNVNGASPSGVRAIFHKNKLHGNWYQPKIQRRDCREFCSLYSKCRSSEW